MILKPFETKLDLVSLSRSSILHPLWVEGVYPESVHMDRVDEAVKGIYLESEIRPYLDARHAAQLPQLRKCLAEISDIPLDAEWFFLCRINYALFGGYVTCQTGKVRHLKGVGHPQWYPAYGIGISIEDALGDATAVACERVEEYLIAEHPTSVTNWQYGHRVPHGGYTQH